MFEELLGQYGWIAITFALGFFFKESIMNMIQGMLVFIGNDFNNDDIIYISGREARIVRVGITKTVFYMTDRGTKMIVPNDRLKHLVIEKTLPKNGGGGKGNKVNPKKKIYDGQKFVEENV